MWVRWFRNVIWIFEPVAFGLVSVKSVVVFFLSQYTSVWFQCSPAPSQRYSTLPVLMLRPKPARLVFFFLRVGPRARGCQHQVQCVFVDCANGWAAPHLISHHWEVKSFNIHLLLCRPWDDEVCWIVLLFFLFRGSWLLNSMEEFCGAVNSVCICVLVAKVLSKHNTASM